MEEYNLPTIYECYKHISGVTLKLEENASYRLPLESIPHLFEEYLIPDKNAYYVKIPTDILRGKMYEKNIHDCDCGHDHGTPFILLFKENYNDLNDFLDFDFQHVGDLSESEFTDVAIIRSLNLTEAYSKRHTNLWSFEKNKVISGIIKRTSQYRQSQGGGTEVALSRLEDVEFNSSEGHITFTWHTSPTAVRTKGGGKMTPPTVPTVPDIANSRYINQGKAKVVVTSQDKVKSGERSKKNKSKPDVNIKRSYSINFDDKDHYTMQIRFYENKQWKKKAYKDFTVKDIDLMFNEAHVKFFCSCPHFNWGAVAYNLTLVGSSIQPQKSPGKGIWLARHQVPHLLCKHLANLQNTIDVQRTKMVSKLKKIAIETKIDDEYGSVVSSINKRRNYNKEVKNLN
jgi:hypothetical protein